MNNILLARGERGVIIGQTGSGKTVGAIWQLQHIPVSPVIIMDTKGEPEFNRIARQEEELVIYDSAAEFVKAYPKIDADYIIVRPSPEEMADASELDEVLARVYRTGMSCLLYIDEAYQWHVGGRAGAGLIGVLTRGRSKGITTLISTQRPAWVSRFVFTESQKMYIYRITDKRDRKTLAEYIPDFDDRNAAEKFFFWYYDVCTGREPHLYKPVPKPALRDNGGSPLKTWI